jgi:leucyl aminopeptidase
MGEPSRRTTRAVAAFDPIPSRRTSARLVVDVAATIPADATAVAVPVGTDGDVNPGLGLSRAALTAAGFTGAVGQALPIPGDVIPELVAVGVGDPATLDTAALRDAAAAFARAYRAAWPHRSRPAGSLGRRAGRCRPGDRGGSDPRPLPLPRLPGPARRGDPGAPGAGGGAGAARGRRGRGRARPDHRRGRAGCPRPREHAAHASVRDAHGRDRPGARRGDRPRGRGLRRGALVEMGCGGLLGVNAGSGEPARMVKLTYRPEGEPAATSGSSARGSCTTPAASASSRRDAMHAAMKLDMSGAAAVLGAMTALRDLGCPAQVTGYLMCTDNMPSGTAMRLGDVLTIRGGKTVEVFNTDAEGRLVMADGIVLATEEGSDAIVTIATLTGRGDADVRFCLRGGPGQQPDLVDQLRHGRRHGRRAGVAAAAGPEVPPPARLEDRRHQEHGRRERRHDHGRAVPRGLRRRHPVRPPGHLRPDDDRATTAGAPPAPPPSAPGSSWSSP